MPDTLLSNKQKKEIIKLVDKSDYTAIISLLDSVSTAHAGTAKTKDKRFAISEIVKHVNGKFNTLKEKKFFRIGKQLCSKKELIAKEIGGGIIWRGYSFNKRSVTDALYILADHDNWEVREYAAGALASITRCNNNFYKTLQKWVKDKSPRIRRAVVLASVGLEDGNIMLAFRLLEPLLYDDDIYVKKNLGPFVLGGTLGRHFPNEFFRQLDKWIKIKEPQVRWNIAMSFNNSLGYIYPEKAMKYLKILKNDNNPVVQRAVKSTVNHLRKRIRNLAL